MVSRTIVVTVALFATVGSGGYVATAAAASGAVAREAEERFVLELQEEVWSEAERRRAERQVAARPLELVAPYFMVEDEAEATLYLLNGMTDPL